jgi:hypothetical protein
MRPHTDNVPPALVGSASSTSPPVIWGSHVGRAGCARHVLHGFYLRLQPPHARSTPRDFRSIFLAPICIQVYGSGAEFRLQNRAGPYSRSGRARAMRMGRRLQNFRVRESHPPEFLRRIAHLSLTSCQAPDTIEVKCMSCRQTHTNRRDSLSSGSPAVESRLAGLGPGHLASVTRGSRSWFGNSQRSRQKCGDCRRPTVTSDSRNSTARGSTRSA